MMIKCRVLSEDAIVFSTVIKTHESGLSIDIVRLDDGKQVQFCNTWDLFFLLSKQTAVPY